MLHLFQVLNAFYFALDFLATTFLPMSWLDSELLLEPAVLYWHKLCVQIYVIFIFLVRRCQTGQTRAIKQITKDHHKQLLTPPCIVECVLSALYGMCMYCNVQQP